MAAWQECEDAKRNGEESATKKNDSTQARNPRDAKQRESQRSEVEGRQLGSMRGCIELWLQNSIGRTLMSNLGGLFKLL